MVQKHARVLQVAGCILGCNFNVLTLLYKSLSGDCYFVTVKYIAVLADKITKEFRCYEAKIEESEKADSHQETTPGHL